VIGWSWAYAGGWDEVPSEVVAAWDEGAGAAAAAREAAAADAGAGAVAASWDLIVQSQRGYPGQDQLLLAAEGPLALGPAGEVAWRATAARRSADGDWARWSYVDEAVDRFVAWAEAEALLGHLADWASASQADLQRGRLAAAEGLLSAVSLDDLEAELALVQAERASWSAVAAARAGAWRAWVGPRAVDPALLGPPPSDDPWAGFVGASPEAAASSATSSESAAAGRALSRSAAPRAQVGALFVGTGEGWAPLAWGGLTVPLGHPDRAEARDARGRAAAEALEATAAADRWSRALAGQSEAFVAERARHQLLVEEVIRPLTSRLTRLEEAFLGGHVTADRVVRARRELHEAEHEAVASELALRAHRLRAAAWSACVEGS
jgi:hypothetical protein